MTGRERTPSNPFSAMVQCEHKLRGHFQRIQQAIDHCSTTPLTNTQAQELNSTGRKLYKQFQSAILQGEVYQEQLASSIEAKAFGLTLTKHKRIAKELNTELRNMTLAYKLQMNKQSDQDRAKLLGSAAAAGELRKRARQNAASTRNTSDVTASLRRTRKVMAQQMHRAATASSVLNDGKEALRNTSAEYQQMHGELDGSKQLLTDLERQAQADKLWIGTGLLILVAVVVYVLYERILVRFL